ncbi:hypothetical protein ACHRV5_03305 [Flavobacterium sp. FlaQc-52]|jgi:hypothetical protein|uniref:hypothetical protein n=1 Tax=Flavobacterium sp. FlaQc-52 TaxID=3374185 RepID=UPI0037573D82
MEESRIKTFEELKHLASYHFKMLRPAQSVYEGHIREIKFDGYSDMIGLGVNLIRICLHIVQTDELDNRDIYIGSVLELALQLIPSAELELLDEIYKLKISDSEDKGKNTKDTSEKQST